MALDDLNVQNFEQKTGVVSKEKVDKAKKKRRRIINIIRLVFILAIAFAIYLVFQKIEFPKFITDGKAKELFEKKQDAIIKAKEAGNEIELDFTELEVNSLASKLTNEESTGKVKIKEIFIDLQEESNVTIYIKTLIFNQEIHLCCSGKVSANDNGLIFEPSGFFAAKVGKLPYPMFLFKYLTKNVISSDDKLNKLFDAISSIEVTEGKAEYKPMPGENLSGDGKKTKEKEAEKGKARIKTKK